MKSLCLILIFFTFYQNPLSAQVTIQSADGVDVEVDDRSRIITIGGSITETVYALGMGDMVIATDESSTYPAEIEEKERVPYKRNLTAEGILALNPTLILAADDAEPVVVIEQLRSTGVDVVLVKDGLNLESVSKKIAFIGKAVGKEAAADKLIEKNRKNYMLAERSLEGITSKPKVMFILSQQGPNAFMVAGQGTEAEAIIQHAGGINAFSDFKGYKPVTNEAMAVANPDVILFMDGRREALPEDITLVPGLNLTKAVKENRIKSMDGNLLLGFGPRFGEAVQSLMHYLHPNLKTNN